MTKTKEKWRGISNNGEKEKQDRKINPSWKGEGRNKGKMHEQEEQKKKWRSEEKVIINNKRGKKEK